MNYLAHTLLSKRHVDYQLGNLLCDTLKGREWEGCSESHRAGLAMHKRIDRFTDYNPIVVNAIARLGRGYLKGVVIDITFDHFLSKHWSQFVTLPQTEFTAIFYQQAQSRLSHLSDKGRDFAERIITYDILNSYDDFNELALVLTRVDRRLSPRLRSKESATDYLPRLAAKYDALEVDFLQFFPMLVEMFFRESKATENEHYFRD